MSSVTRYRTQYAVAGSNTITRYGEDEWTVSVAGFGVPYRFALQGTRRLAYYYSDMQKLAPSTFSISITHRSIVFSGNKVTSK
jgi:hypothetical protein